MRRPAGAAPLSTVCRAYRLFIYSDDGQLIGPAKIIHAANDTEAIAQAEVVRGSLAARPRLSLRFVSPEPLARGPVEATLDRNSPEYKGARNEVHNIARVYTPDEKGSKRPIRTRPTRSLARTW
jgi:hypothetical protein